MVPAMPGVGRQLSPPSMSCSSRNAPCAASGPPGAAVRSRPAAASAARDVIHPRVVTVDPSAYCGVVLVAIQAARRSRGGSDASGSQRSTCGSDGRAIFAVEFSGCSSVYRASTASIGAGIARAAAARVPPGGSVGALTQRARSWRAPLLRRKAGRDRIGRLDAVTSGSRRGWRVIVAEAGIATTCDGRAMRITEGVWSGGPHARRADPMDDAAKNARAEHPRGGDDGSSVAVAAERQDEKGWFVLGGANQPATNTS